MRAFASVQHAARVVSGLARGNNPTRPSVSLWCLGYTPFYDFLLRLQEAACPDAVLLNLDASLHILAASRHGLDGKEKLHFLKPWDIPADHEHAGKVMDGTGGKHAYLAAPSL